MFVDKYSLNAYGSIWSKGKEKKNQLTTTISHNQGIRLKDLDYTLDDFIDKHSLYETEIEVIINIRPSTNHP